MTAAHIMKTYSPQPVAFSRGEGAWLWDTQGKRYLDALAGIAVNGLGHGHPVLTKAIDATYLRGKRLWLTEYGFGTRKVPQYPFAFGAANQGPFIADAYRRAKANARVGLLVYYLLQDHPQWASGVLTQAGTPKPGLAVMALSNGLRPRTGPTKRTGSL